MDYEKMEENILGRRIKKRLRALNKTQGWLAEKLDVTDNAISKWIKGDSGPTFSNLKAMGKVLECSVGYLAGDETDEDVAAIELIARQMDGETRRYYRKSGDSLVKPEGQKNNKHAAK